MPIDLAVPADRTAPPKDLEVRPKAVKAWVESLPLAQSIDAAKKLCVHLAALNRAKLESADRELVLEAYRPIATVVLDELEAIYAKASLPLSPKARDALGLARDLASCLAVGHKILIADKSGNKLLGFGSGRKQLPLHYHRAFVYVGELLKAAYKSYTPVPEGVWRELHRLYLAAEQEKLVAEVADPETKEPVIAPYFECLLLSLTDPYRLVPGEAEKVVAQFRAARAPVTLGQARPATRSSAHFMVPCDQDKAPKPALSANDDTGGPNWRILDANPLVDKLRLKMNAIETGNVSATTRGMVSPETLPLMRKLETLWGDPPKRAHRRLPSEGTVAICAGIKAIAHYVDLEQRQIADADGVRRGITMPLMPLPLDEAEQPIPVYEYDVVNRSEGGLKVRRLGATAQPVAVGEVVGIMEAGARRWSVGVMRWVTVFEDGGMEFGLQFLAPSAQPVAVQPTITSSTSQVRMGLLLDSDEQPGVRESLLAPVNTYSELREFELDDEGSISRVRARGLIEKTARFELFHVSPS